MDTPRRHKADMDSEIEASGLTALLVRIRDESTPLPIYVFENGATFDDDPNQHLLDHNLVAYLRERISAMHDAIDTGVKVQGSFAWRRLDNFEWAFSDSCRFGTVWMDFPAGNRLSKPRFDRYRVTIRSHSVAYAKSTSGETTPTTISWRRARSGTRNSSSRVSSRSLSEANRKSNWLEVVGSAVEN